LHEAARKGRVEVAAYLIRAGAQPNIVDGLGQTPLDTAQAANQWGVADLLIRQCDGIGNCGRSGSQNPLPPPAVTSAQPRPWPGHRFGPALSEGTLGP
jgi:hypothetical protein